MDILSKLLGGLARVKMMRLFLLNASTIFETRDIATRSKITQPTVRSELITLKTMGFVRQKSIIKEPVSKRKGLKKKQVTGYALNPSFPYLAQMRALLIDPDFLKQADLLERFKPTGKIKLLVAAGIFIQNEESRVDLLIVGDNLKRTAIEHIIRSLEAEIGRELIYALFETQDFIYRLNMYDKLVRDILDYPHDKIIDTQEFSTFPAKKS